MNYRHAISILVLLLFAPVCSADSTSQQADPFVPSVTEMKPALETISQAITDELADLREENRLSAEVLATTGLSGKEAKTILSLKLGNLTYGHSSLAISPDNMVIAAAPSSLSGLLGKDLSYQPETKYANEKKSPVVSSIFYLEEGFYGISISYPVFAEDKYLGYTDVTIRPEEFLRPVIGPFTEQTGYEVFILQPDGMTVYETNEVEIGTNVLTDPIYSTPEMRNVSEKVIDDPEGTMTYTFWDQNWNRQVKKQAVWKSLELDNQEWRVGVVREIDAAGVESSAVSESKPQDLNASIADMTSFVRDAAEYARSSGVEEACTSFNNLSGPYVQGDSYIFGYDMNGTALALPYQQGMLGKNRIDLADMNGVSIMTAMIDAAKRGGDYLYVIYPNPTNGYRKQLKIFRIEPVDDTWFIGSGIFLPWVAAEIDQEKIDALVARVKNAVGHAGEAGKDQAIQDFNDLNRSFADGGSYIFAYDYNGTTLALPHQPEVIGTDRMNYTDMYGAQITAQEIDAARRGGGYVYVVYYNPDTGNTEFKLCYVLPVGEDWMTGSGIYTGTNLV